MRFQRLNLDAYGRCKDVAIEIGDPVTVVVGTNEAGKSTALDALTDFLWGIPPKSSRSYEFTRPQLRIGATLDINGQIRTLTRKSTGLLEQDLVTDVPPPWNLSNALGRDWWRTRLGINHSDLRAAGREAFDGGGDLAEIIFAAREGRSAKTILEQITTRIEKLYKSHAGAKSVLLRVAANKYKAATQDLQTRLTSADKVVAQRGLVKSLETRHRDAVEARNESARDLKRALEDQRVVEAVLRLNQARTELAKITEEGDRLSPSELTEYLEATASLNEVSKQINKLDATIKGKQQSIDALSVDDGLLDDKVMIERLQSETQARIDDLKRADQEFGPAAAGEASQLRELLQSIGIEETEDLDNALARVGVRADHAATLDSLADQIEELEEKRRQAQEKRENSLTDLSVKGINIDISTAQMLSEEGISDLREKLTAARDLESTAQALMDAARAETNALRASAPTHVSLRTLNHADVIAAREARDECWLAVRRSWLNGDLPSPGDRHDMATKLDTTMLQADGISDQEAAERSRIATLDALIGAHVDGLEAAKEKEAEAHKHLSEVTQERTRLDDEWNSTWNSIGLTTAPSTTTSSAIAGLIFAANAANREAQSSENALAELTQSWRQAAESVGLRAVDTTAGWRKQAEVLGQIHSIETKRIEFLDREADARRKWAAFAAEAVELLRRHRAAEKEQPINLIQIEQGLARLLREVGETAEAAAKRAAYGEQIAEQSALRAEAQQSLEGASAALIRLADSYGLASTDELSILVERAKRASDPLAREVQAHIDIQINLDGGSDPAVAIERLLGRDQISVDQDAAEAQERFQNAEKESDRLLREVTTARDTLAQLENASSAAEAEADVASSEAEVARLAEEWAILTLQKAILTRALDALGSSDTSPLLDHAGRILDRLTEGRWVALQAADDGSTRKLSVVRGDAEKLGTAELSEGTADQVFFALRLAAVAELHNERTAAGEPPLPLVLDDVLMTFDDQRTDRALDVLANLAPGLQVIVFTHHKFIADIAAQSDWATVSRLTAPSPIDSSIDGEQLRAKLQGATISHTV